MSADSSNDELRGLLAPYAEQVVRDLRQLLIEPGTPQALAEAMEYCVLGGGKRLRPALTHLAAEAVGARAGDDLTGRSAVAVELVHCYSLVHDDLPAMDNDRLRRGRPTAHVKFGEAMAILAGDALLTRAFAVLAGSGQDQACRLAAELACAAGAAGMVAGQAADMGLCPTPDGPAGLQFIHSRKTAAMIRAAVRMGAICGQAGEDELAAIGEYGEALGQAFQLADDLLDVTGDRAQLGKTPGKDAAVGKRTYVSELGQAQAASIGQDLTARAVEALVPLGQSADKLARLAKLLAERKS